MFAFEFVENSKTNQLLKVLPFLHYIAAISTEYMHTFLQLKMRTPRTEVHVHEHMNTHMYQLKFPKVDLNR